MFIYNGKDKCPEYTTSVQISEGVTSIGFGAFRDCCQLVSIVIPPCVTSIMSGAFVGCLSLRHVEISSSVTRIGNGAFRGCTSLSKIEIPSSVTRIGNAFYECSSLSLINIPETEVTIENSAFRGCTSLTSIIIPPSVTTIGDGAFHGCTSLTSVFIPPAVTNIGDGAFHCCSSLASIIIPSTVTHVGRLAFFGCTSLNAAENPVNIDSTTVTTNPITDSTAAATNTNNNSYNSETTGVWLRNRYIDLPLHQACYCAQVTEEKIQAIIEDNSSETVRATDELGMTALHVLACNPFVTPNMIRSLLEVSPDLATVENARGLSPTMMYLTCKCIPYRDNLRRLTLKKALKRGLQWDTIEMIMALDKSSLLEQYREDKKTGLYPFMIAANLNQCELDTVYKLIRKNVHILLTNR